MKINVEFDTQDKTITATMNGQNIENLSSISFYSYEGQGNVELCTVEMNETEKMVKVTRVMAQEKDELVVKEEPVYKQIASLLMKNGV